MTDHAEHFLEQFHHRHFRVWLTTAAVLHIATLSNAPTHITVNQAATDPRLGTDRTLIIGLSTWHLISCKRKPTREKQRKWKGDS
jgi:hypothetical protein